MSGKDKLRKFKENESFSCLIQPATEEVLNVDHPLKGRWHKDFFGNDNPIVLELGCGKGEYTVGLAELDPSKNYIGVDIKGARLWKGAKYASENKMPNVAFLRTRIEFITSMFARGEVAEIWITFADPQINREKKRLTSPLFIGRYSEMMDRGGRIHLKTDSEYLYSYTKALAEQNSMTIVDDCDDLYARENLDKTLCIKTFYESHYLRMGMPIHYFSFLLDNDNPVHSPEWDGTELALKHKKIQF